MGTVNLRKVGHSYVITISAQMREQMQMKDIGNGELQYSFKGKQLVLEVGNTEPNIDDLVGQMKKGRQPKEIDLGARVGAELI